MWIPLRDSGFVKFELNDILIIDHCIRKTILSPSA